MTEAIPLSQPVKVLVVDDTPTNLQMLQIFLKRHGYEVILASDGLKAVELFSSERPDIVLMDVMMPGMDGYEATRRIKALCGDAWVPVIFLSALDKEKDLVAGLDAGGDDYLAKPVNFVVLDAKLRSFVRSLHLSRRLAETGQRLSAITDTMVDALISIDEMGIIRWCNPAALQIFGYSMEELTGQNISILMPDPWHSEHDGYLHRYKETGIARILGNGQRELLARRKNHELFPIELAVTETALDGTRQFVGVLRDISYRKAAENQLRDNAERLQRYHDDHERETHLARTLVERMMRRQGLSDRRVRHWIAPATEFSGDIVGAALSMDGRLYTLLADATGHGLPAAVSVLPVLTAFYMLAEQGLPLEFLVREINRHLCDSMPSSHFVAAVLMCLDPEEKKIDIWAGGMPPVLHVSAEGQIKAELPATHIPLGIMEADEDMIVPHRVSWTEGDEFIVVSDGLIECGDPSGEPFDMARLKDAISRSWTEERLESIREAVETHVRAEERHDDISLLIVRCLS